MKHLELKQKVNNVNLKKGVYQYNLMAEQKLHMSFISKNYYMLQKNLKKIFRYINMRKLKSICPSILSFFIL